MAKKPSVRVEMADREYELTPPGAIEELNRQRAAIFAQQRPEEETQDPGKPGSDPNRPVPDIIPPTPDLPHAPPEEEPDPTEEEKDAEDDEENREWNPDNPEPVRAPRDEDIPEDAPRQAKITDIERPRADGLHYESRIQILDAFQYLGTLRDAPDWVDKNWVGWGDWDPVREIEPGPALRVPLVNSDAVVLARIGDYVCKQSVTIHPDAPSHVRVEVWEQRQFERLFMPVSRDDLMSIPGVRPSLPSAHRVSA